MRRYVFASAIAAVLTASAFAGSPLPVPSPAFLTEPSIADDSRSSFPYDTGFEASDGFTLGWINNQPASAPAAEQWQTHVSSTDQGVVSNAAPYAGSQHLELGPDSSGSGSGAWSPELDAPIADTYVFDLDVNIGSTDGADYDVIGQSPSQGKMAFRIKHFYNDYDGDALLGDVLVVDDSGGGLQWIDSGFDYPENAYYHMRVTIDFVGGETSYDFWTNADDFYADTAPNWSYTAIAASIGSTNIEQTVFLCDGHNEGEVGSFDNLQITIPEPAAAALFAIAAIAIIRRRH